jgi:hypothetical protein
VWRRHPVTTRQSGQQLSVTIRFIEHAARSLSGGLSRGDTV